MLVEMKSYWSLHAAAEALALRELRVLTAAHARVSGSQGMASRI